jgi:BirA family biotin operon repressor/biotin-[acetyl-CoA-carboxylase] ligase
LSVLLLEEGFEEGSGFFDLCWPGTPPTHLFTLVGEIAVSEAIEQVTQLDTQLKWPNDVLINGRKVAGVLVEARNRDCVIGIGINCNQNEEDLCKEIRDTATSIAIETCAVVNREELAESLLQSLDRWTEVVTSGGAGEVYSAWTSKTHVIGQRVRLIEKGSEFTGTILDVSPLEGLVVRLDEGGIRLFRPPTTRIC